MLALTKYSVSRRAFSLSRFSSPTLPSLQNTVVLNPNRTNKISPVWTNCSVKACGITQNRCATSDGGGGITVKGESIFGNPISVSSQLDLFVRAGLRPELMPKHVAAILDGNRRWAKAHGKELDYTAFCQGYMALADLCIKWGITTLSCFIFSTENWKRPKEANDLLFQHFERQLKESLDSFMRQGIRVWIIGQKTRLPECLQEVIKQVEEATKNNTKLEMIFAVSYGGKWDITQAIQSTSKKVEAGLIEPEEINEALLEEQLSTQLLRYPDPDLMIRTGGDQRVSNFLIWQMYHTEFYFTDVYGPDFGEVDFIDALRWFQQSDRLFGK